MFVFEYPFIRTHHTKLSLLIYLSSCINFVTLSFNLHSADWWMMTYLFTYESKIICYELICFTQNWIKLLFVSISHIVETSYSMNCR